MRKLLLICGLFLAGLGCISQSDAFWQSRDSNYNISTSGGGGGYTGPGDIVSGAWAFWSLRCYNAAYSGNVAQVWDTATGSTTETLLTCSAGGTLNQTINTLATTCAVSCSVKILYDQSGASNCSGACNLTNGATASGWPTLTVNFLSSGHPCMAVTNAVVTEFLANTSAASQAQPFTLSAVAERTGNTSANNTLFSSNDTDVWSFFGSGGNDMRLSTSLAQFSNETASDSSPHTFQQVYSGGSSSDLVDSTSNTGLALGATGMSVNVSIGARASSASPLVGNICELGVWASAVSGGNQTSLSSNQHTYWGF